MQTLIFLRMPVTKAALDTGISVLPRGLWGSADPALLGSLGGSSHPRAAVWAEMPVSGAQQGRSKINRIWFAARDVSRPQRLWYFAEAQNKNQLPLLSSACYWFCLKEIFQEQMQSNKAASSSCTSALRTTGCFTGCPSAICFQAYLVIRSCILFLSISEANSCTDAL